MIAQRDITTHFPTRSRVATDAQHGVGICARHLSNGSRILIADSRIHPAHNRTVKRKRESPVSFSRVALARSRFIISIAAHFARHAKSPTERSCLHLAYFRRAVLRAAKDKEEPSELRAACTRTDFPALATLDIASIRGARKDGRETTITTGECFHDGDCGSERRAGLWADAQAATTAAAAARMR